MFLAETCEAAVFPDPPLPFMALIEDFIDLNLSLVFRLIVIGVFGISVIGAGRYFIALMG